MKVTCRHTGWFATCIVALAVAGCQPATTGGGTSSAAVQGGGSTASQASNSARSYNVFFDQSDHLKELVAASDWSGVVTLYSRERSYFTQNRDNAAVTTGLAKAANALAAERAVALRAAAGAISAVSWPAPPARWPAAAKAVKDADAAIDAFGSEPILTLATNIPPEKASLQSAVTTLRDRIASSAGNAFAEFDHRGDADFFADYPVDVDRGETIRAALPTLLVRLASASPAEIGALVGRYGADMRDEDRERVSGLAFQSLVRSEAGGKDPSLDDVLDALARAEQMGIEPGTLDEPRIRFVEITSRTLLKEGQIEFPVAVDVDLPVDFGKASLDTALGQVASDGLDYLIVFDVAVARAIRRVATQDRVSSQFQSSVRYEPNPARTTRALAVQQAQANLQGVNIRASTGCIGCGLIPALIHAAAMASARQDAETALQSAIRQLEAEPVNLEKPVWSGYSFNRANIDSRKVMSINYYVIDLKERTYFKSFVTVNEQQAFVVPYQLHDKDRNRSQHLTGANTEDDVSSF